MLQNEVAHMTNIMPNSLYVTFNTTIISITRYQETLLISTNNGCQNQYNNCMPFVYDIIILNCSFSLCILTYLYPKKIFVLFQKIHGKITILILYLAIFLSTLIWHLDLFIYNFVNFPPHCFVIYISKEVSPHSKTDNESNTFWGYNIFVNVGFIPHDKYNAQ